MSYADICLWYIHRDIDISSSFLHNVVTLFFHTACILSIFTWYHILRLHSFMFCESTVIYLSSSGTQPAQTKTPDLSLQVWSSSRISHPVNGGTIHPLEYDTKSRNHLWHPLLSICTKIQSSTHYCWYLLFKRSLSLSPHHHPSPGGHPL